MCCSIIFENLVHFCCERFIYKSDLEQIAQNANAIKILQADLAILKMDQIGQNSHAITILQTDLANLKREVSFQQLKINMLSNTSKAYNKTFAEVLTTDQRIHLITHKLEAFDKPEITNLINSEYRNILNNEEVVNIKVNAVSEIHNPMKNTTDGIEEIYL